MEMIEASHKEITDLILNHTGGTIETSRPPNQKNEFSYWRIRGWKKDIPIWGLV